VDGNYWRLVLEADVGRFTSSATQRHPAFWCHSRVERVVESHQRVLLTWKS
jgi:hypothetical protein